MKIDPAYRIERIAADADDERPALGYVSIETYGNQPVAVAADGFMLAVVPVELDEEDTLGLVHHKAFTYARLAASKGHDLFIGLSDEEVAFIDRWAAPRRVDKNPLTFPDWRKVVPARANLDDAWPAFALQPSYLAKLAEALGQRFVVLHRSADLQILVAPSFTDGAPEPPFGVLMPANAGSLPTSRQWAKRREGVLA